MEVIVMNLCFEKNINHYRLFQIGTSSGMNNSVHAELNWKATVINEEKRDWGKGLVFDSLWGTVMKNGL